MTWPEAIYKIIIEGGTGLLTAIVLLAVFTDFWEYVFNRKVIETEVEVEVEVLPEQFVSYLRRMASEMTEMSGSDQVTLPSSIMMRAWSKRIEDAIADAEQEFEDD